MTRRALLALPIAFSTACRTRRTFAGIAFVANHDGNAVAAVDLGVFAVAKQIPLDGAPTAILSSGRRGGVFALTGANGRIHEIGVSRLDVSRSVTVCSHAAAAILSSDAALLFVLCNRPAQLVALSTSTLRPVWTARLTAPPLDAAVSPDGRWLVVSYGPAGSIERFDLANQRSAGRIPLDAEAGIVAFQSNSEQFLVANTGERMLNVYESTGGRLVVKLPLALRPEHFCFNSDGGQLFVTGEGSDSVVIVYPYFTPQIGETILAGRAPGAMAATPDLLFAANSHAGDVSILHIESRKLIAVAPAGSNPSFIAVTPDYQYALVLNSGSGDMGVIWIPGLTRTRARSAPLFTLIPVGSRPIATTIVPV